MIEKYHQSLFRYFAVHTNGDLHTAQQMTTDTLSILCRTPTLFAKQSLTSWLFGIAWDVLNAHYSCKDTKVIQQQTIDSGLQVSNWLQALRSMAFYPRETLYLRFFAGLNAKNIGVLMDKSEIAVKLLIYEAMLEFAARIDGIVYMAQPREKILPLARAYHLYLDDVFRGITPGHAMPLEVIQTTYELLALREAITMKPEAYSELVAQMETVIRPGNTSATRL